MSELDETNDLRVGLAKLRRATEFALGYPPQTIHRAEAHALLDYIEHAVEVAQLGASLSERLMAGLESIPRDQLDMRARVKLIAILDPPQE